MKTKDQKKKKRISNLINESTKKLTNYLRDKSRFFSQEKVFVPWIIIEKWLNEGPSGVW